MKNLLILLAIVFLPSSAYANFSIKIENTFNKKMFYMLFWIDHGYDWPKPVNVAGGELAASEVLNLRTKYEPGKYYVVWGDGGEWKNNMLLVINKDVTLVTITPQKWISEKAGT